MDWLNLLSGILSHPATVTFLGVFAAFALGRFIDHAKNTINKKTFCEIFTKNACMDKLCRNFIPSFL
jgi:hypothetical protein